MNIPTGKIEDYLFYSKALKEEVNLLIYLPAHFSPLQKYSLCIANDGKDYFQMGRIGRVADSLLYENKINEMIIVGIPYINANDRRVKYHPNGEKHEAYIYFLVHELLPFLEEKFPIHSDGQNRALIGDSLAGTISFLTALRYPHAFGKVLMQSPYVDEQVLEAVRMCSNPLLLQLDQTIGRLEYDVAMTNGEHSDFLKPNRTLRRLLTDYGFQLHYQEFEGNHTWKYWQKDLPRALENLFTRSQ